MYNAYLFDLDGVLIDSESRYSEIWDSIDKMYPTGVQNFPQVIKGTTLHNILTTYFKPEDMEAVKGLLHSLESEMVYDWCPGALDALLRLRKMRVKIALVTSSDDKKMSHLFAQIPYLPDLFDTIVDATCVTRSKPDPQGYLLAAERLGVPPEKCVVVEDAVQGLKAGKAAGAATIGVVGTWDKATLRPEADRLIEHLSQLFDSNIVGQ